MLLFPSLVALAASVIVVISRVNIVVLPRNIFDFLLSKLGSHCSQIDIVDTVYARYLGNRTYPNTIAYLGIPYAEPPLGEGRFRRPTPLNMSRISLEAALLPGGVVDATEYPMFCVQGSVTGEDAGGTGSEDCLKVNVYSPVGAKLGSNFPVLFYIHGGGYVYGNPANFPFDHWIKQSPNVVIVSVYYRLSSFGFLATPDFRDSNDGDLNNGFRDQIEALKWVKQNIAYFGGNPEEVTINGESAGGASVELHLVAKEKETLFSRAFAQSLYRSPLPTPEQQMPLFMFYSEYAGCGAPSVSSIIACLRRANVSVLARAQDAAYSPSFNGTYKIFRPVVDGTLIEDYPTKTIMSGEFKHVPFVVGATTNDGPSWGTGVATAMRDFFPLLDDTDTKEIESAYVLEDFDSEEHRFHAIGGESVNTCSVSITAEVSSRYSATWTYRYNQRNPTSTEPGVSHAAENWMMFRGTNTGFNGSAIFTEMNPSEVGFSEELIAYWLSFVRTGNPNVYKLARSPQWPLFTTHNWERAVLQQPDARGANSSSGVFLESIPSAEVQRCAVVAEKASHEQN